MKRLIRESDVVDASGANKVVLVEEHSLITPLAYDRAKELGVKFEPVLAGTGQNSTAESGLQTETFPVKVLAIGSDHGGYAMKEDLKVYLRDLGYIVHDLGTDSSDACDYPDFAFKVARAVSGKKVDRGIMIDSVGIGSAMAANRVKGILAAKCNNAFEARSAREHNYANVLTLGAKIIGSEIAREIARLFLETPGGAERHKKRIDKIIAAE